MTDERQPPPTLDEIELCLAVPFSTIDAKRILHRLRDLLKSGDYALLSREDREAALAFAYASDRAERAEARTLLKLEPR